MYDKTLILLVDDNKMNLRRAQEILQEENYAVAAAISGEQAIRFVERNAPDLILMDINMPEMDGFDTIKTIKEMPNGMNVPFIFLTAQDDVESEVKGFELGAEDFIKKPFVSSIVKKRVRRAIESYNLRNNLQNEVYRQTKKVEEKREELKKLSMEIIQTLAATIDTKDPYTKGHSARVSQYSMMLAKAIGWEDNAVEELGIMALLHDVGKIGVPDRVLNKPGRLEPAEYDIIKTHTTNGDAILKGVSSLDALSKVARHHHERYDGTGYPDGIAGKEIEMEARIVGIADAYDAMSSNRVYRNALEKDTIRKELVKGRGTQFDPDLLDVFLDLFDRGLVETSEEDNLAKTEATDITQFMKILSNEGDYDGAMKLSHNELVKMYSYLKSFGERYGDQFSIILISLECDLEKVSDDQILQAMSAMEYSILQALRKTDMTSRVSDTQQLVVLAQPGDHIKLIIDRVFAGYYRNCLYTEIKPVYELINEESF